MADLLLIGSYAQYEGPADERPKGWEMKDEARPDYTQGHGTTIVPADLAEKFPLKLGVTTAGFLTDTFGLTYDAARFLLNPEAATEFLDVRSTNKRDAMDTHDVGDRIEIIFCWVDGRTWIQPHRKERQIVTRKIAAVSLPGDQAERVFANLRRLAIAPPAPAAS